MTVDVSPGHSEPPISLGCAAVGSNQRHSTSAAKIASSASKSPRRQASNPCCATVRLELLLITPPRWRLPRKISVPGERRVGSILVAHHQRQEGSPEPVGVVDDVAA